MTANLAIIALLVALVPALPSWAGPPEFAPKGPQDSHAIQRRLYANVDKLMLDAGRGETQWAPPPYRNAAPGTDFARLRFAAARMGLPIEVFYVHPSSDLHNSSSKGAHYIELSDFVVRFASDTALAFHLAHEYAHLELGHNYLHMAASYRQIAHRCPECVDTLNPAITLLSRTDEDAAALKPLRHQQELEADRWAFERILDNGFEAPSAQALIDDALGYADFGDRLPLTESDSHPSRAARIEALEQAYRARHAAPPV